MSQECNKNCTTCEQGCEERADFRAKLNEMSSVKKVIAVVSGKGGVGKSFVTSMLAVLMNREGFQTAILDADVTGPSIPKAFGLHQKAEGSDLGIFPVKTNTGISVMSLNLLLEHDTDPVVWRGPIIAGAVKQFWTDVVWGDVDYMFVDMPPGTGDVPLTVFQSLPVDGIIVVASPQELVGMIVEKAVNMANKMNIPILGLVENMSYFQCPDCGSKHYIFGESHIDEIAKRHVIDTVCVLPIDPKFAAATDAGTIELLEENNFADMIKILKSERKRNMRIAVTYVDGQVFQHFGHTESFKIYDTVDGKITAATVKDTNGSGHGALAGILGDLGVQILICGGIGGGAKRALEEAGIKLYGGVSGDADKAVEALLSRKLRFDPNVTCDHHGEHSNGECGNHGCGEHHCGH